MRALSIRQPYVEQILRGEKTIEFRSWRTHIIGERFYIYASKGGARAARARTIDDLPRGVIVATAVISKCVKNNGHFEWHLTEVESLVHPLKPARHPQPSWFRPF